MNWVRFAHAPISYDGGLLRDEDLRVGEGDGDKKEGVSEIGAGLAHGGCYGILDS